MGSGGFQISRVGSGHLDPIGSGHLGPISPAKSGPTGEKTRNLCGIIFVVLERLALHQLFFGDGLRGVFGGIFFFFFEVVVVVVKGL